MLLVVSAESHPSPDAFAGPLDRERHDRLPADLPLKILRGPTLRWTVEVPPQGHGLGRALRLRGKGLVLDFVTVQAE